MLFVCHPSDLTDRQILDDLVTPGIVKRAFVVSPALVLIVMCHRGQSNDQKILRI